MMVRPPEPCALYPPLLPTVRGSVAAAQAQKATVRHLQLVHSLCYVHHPFTVLCPLATRLAEHARVSRILGDPPIRASGFRLHVEGSRGGSVTASACKFAAYLLCGEGPVHFLSQELH